MKKRKRPLMRKPCPMCGATTQVEIVQGRAPYLVCGVDRSHLGGESLPPKTKMRRWYSADEVEGRTQAALERMLADARLLPRCGECGAQTCWKRNVKTGEAFVGCTAYPKCRASISRKQLRQMIEKRETSRAVLARRRAEISARVDDADARLGR